MTDLRLAAVNGEPIVSIGPLATHDELMAASFITLGEAIIAGKISIEKAVLVAFVDDGLTYQPFGPVTIVEGVGMLELASRKIERDKLAG